MTEPGRRNPARQPVFESGERTAIVFLTVCTAGRKRILDSPAVLAVLLDVWKRADHWCVGRYVILPDHLHLFCSPARHDGLDLKSWIKYWKSLASRRWPTPGDQPVWQLDGWDRQLRYGDSYDAKWQYVRENPVRHGLVEQADDWPYQGEVNVLEWHDA